MCDLRHDETVIGFDESRLPDLKERLLFDTFKDPALIRGIAIHLLNQRDRLWGRAQRVLNKSNSVDDTWTPIPQSTLDELGSALDYCRPRGE